MKRKTVIYSILILVCLFGFGTSGPPPAHAQQNALDTTLARAAARGFLISLTRPELSSLRDFYKLDEVNVDDILAELQGVTAYEIIEADWATGGTYQLTAELQPNNRILTIFTGKYNGRWRVEGLQLAAADPAGTQNTAPVTPSADPGIPPVSGNGNGVLIFQNQSGGDIYKINADGTGLTRITHGIDPQLSPDRRQVAFTRWEPRYELFTIAVDGTNEQAWTHGWRQMKSPTWSADGSKLVFSYQEGGRLDPQQKRFELDEIEPGDRIRIPPEARGVDVENGILRYVIPADAYWWLNAIDLNTGEISKLATERHSYGPSGHPTQSNLLAYKGIQGIAINNSETATDQPVTTDYRDHTPVISPDGSKVVVSYWQDGHWEIHTMNLDGSNRQRLTTTPLSVLARRNQLKLENVMGAERYVAPENPWWNNAAATWSPDGSQIAFLTDRTGQWAIWIMNADGTNQRPMFPNGALDELQLNYAGVDERMLSWR